MPKTVLIVDDHPSFRATAAAALVADGFEVVGEAATAAEAVHEARRLLPDVVLLDVQLPDRDGFEVCKNLCHDTRRPDIVLVSSRDAADYAAPALACGALGFINKAELSGAALSAILDA